jgi:hypothetical protein
MRECDRPAGAGIFKNSRPGDWFEPQFEPLAQDAYPAIN